MLKRQEPDIFIKDEGDFITVVFQSPKALEIGRKELGLKNNKTKIDYPLHVLNTIKEIAKINSLSLHSEV